MSWIRIALAGVIVLAIASAVHMVTAFLDKKDAMIQDRDQNILNLQAQVQGMRIDNERLKTSNSSLEADVRQKIEEAAQARQEANTLKASDGASVQRQNDLERRLNDRERVAQVDRLTHSRHAALVVRTVNQSTECQIAHFFETDGECRSGVWKPKVVPPVAGAASAAVAEGASSAPR